MKPPIIVYDNGDLNIFKTSKDAEGYLESIDVLDNRYVAYDSEGFLLDLKADSSAKIKYFGIELVRQTKVSIERTKSAQSHIDELYKILVNVISKFNISPEELLNVPFERVLEKTIELIGYTK